MLRKGSLVRIYDTGEWFFEGVVIEESETSVDIDFADRIIRFERSQVSVTYEFYDEILVATGAGIVLEEF